MSSDLWGMRPLVSPQLAEAAHNHLYFSGKLGTIVAEFVQKFGVAHESMFSQLLALVDSYRRKTVELTKSTSGAYAPSLMAVWSKLLMTVEQEAKVFQSFSSSTAVNVVAPMLNAISEKKLIWNKCFHFVGMYRSQVQKKEDDMSKQYREYSDSYAKLKIVDHDPVKVERYKTVCHNYHNAYLLLLSSVNGMNGFMYADLLPKILHECESASAALSTSIGEYLKSMSSFKQNCLFEIARLHQDLHEVYQTLDLRADCNAYVTSAEGHVTDDRLKYVEFCPAQDAKESLKLTSAESHVNSSCERVIDLDASFVVDVYTVPSLVRKLALIRRQTAQLEQAISNGKFDSVHTRKPSTVKEVEDSPAVVKVKDKLLLYDKQAKLRVLQKQMELFNSSVLRRLGPVPDNILADSDDANDNQSRQHHSASVSYTRSPSADGQNAHLFMEQKFLKPTSCFFCKGLLIAPIGYCLRCKYCKMQVHKKCADNVPFCMRVPIQKSRTSSFSTGQPSFADPKTIHEEHLYKEVASDSDCDSFDDEFSEFGDNDYEIPPDALPSSPVALHSPSVTPPTRPPVIGPKPSNMALSAAVKDPASKRFSVPALPSERPPFLIGRELPKPPCSPKPPLVSKKPSVPAKQLSKPAEYCVALYDYKPSQASDLALRAGQKIVLSEKSSADWWKGAIDDREGYFPAQYVMVIGASDTPVRCMYRFDAAGGEQVSLSEGQIVVMEKADNANWLAVRTHVNGRGLVPRAYCQILK